MGKTQPETVDPSAKAQPLGVKAVPEPNLNQAHVLAAIEAGKQVIAGGGTKADAARTMFATISEESKETIVAAFVEGATLTTKGALTYWYNCKRKAGRQTPK